MSETSSWFGEIPWVDFHVKIHRNKKIMASPCFAACRGAANSQSFDMFKNPGIFHGAWRIAGERVSHQFDDEYLHWWDWDGIFEYIWQYSASSHERTPKKQVIAWFAWFAITTSYDDAKSKKDSMTQGYPQFFHSSYIIDQSDGTRQIWKKFGFGQVGQVIQVSSFDLSHFLRIRSWNYTQSFDCLLSRFLEAFKKQTTFVFFEICFLRWTWDMFVTVASWFTVSNLPIPPEIWFQDHRSFRESTALVQGPMAIGWEQKSWLATCALGPNKILLFTKREEPEPETTLYKWLVHLDSKSFDGRWLFNQTSSRNGTSLFFLELSSHPRCLNSKMITPKTP